MKYLLLFLLLIFLQGCDADNKQLIILKDGGIGSGAFYHKNDPKNIIYTIKEKPATIYKLDISHDSYKVLKTLRIKKAKKIDAEGLVKLNDGSFYIADETYPSIVHIDSKGNILKRIFPKGSKVSQKNASFSLPKELSSHIKNKGFESIAISPDENYLYIVLQAPPKKKKKGLFIYTYDIKKDRVVNRYKYTLNSSKNFINEMICIKKDILVLLENQKDGYIFYKINLKKDDKKKAIFNFDKLKKIEGVAHLGGKNWLLINDNDSKKDGIKGAMIRVSF